jgi:hypothetical protein
MIKRLAIAAVIVASPAFGQGVDPLVGTWKLNLEKSTFIGTPAPKSETLIIAGEGQNRTNILEGIDSQGREGKVVMMHIYDGMPHPTTGTPNFDASAYTRTGNTINITRFKKGTVVTIDNAVIDPGKTYTVTSGGLIDNQPYYAVRVYDRQ